jgi:hypothetical protein
MLLIALTPKCLLCVLGYAGLGATLGLAGPELCGATRDVDATPFLWLAALGAVLTFARMRAHIVRRQRVSR